MQAVRPESFNSLDVLAGGLRNLHGARASKRAVDVYAACAAQSRPAAEFGASQLEGVPQDPEQWRVRRNIYGFWSAVYLQSKGGHRSLDAAKHPSPNAKKGKMGGSRKRTPRPAASSIP